MSGKEGERPRAKLTELLRQYLGGEVDGELITCHPAREGGPGFFARLTFTRRDGKQAVLESEAAQTGAEAMDNVAEMALDCFEKLVGEGSESSADEERDFLGMSPAFEELCQLLDGGEAKTTREVGATTLDPSGGLIDLRGIGDETVGVGRRRREDGGVASGRLSADAPSFSPGKTTFIGSLGAGAASWQAAQCAAVTNARGELNEELQRYLGRPATKADIVIKCEGEDLHWKATLTFGDLDGKPGGGQVFEGEEVETKRQSERSASSKALEFIRQLADAADLPRPLLPPPPHHVEQGWYQPAQDKPPHDRASLDHSTDDCLPEEIMKLTNPKGKLQEVLMQKLRRPLRMEDLCYQVLACKGQAGFVARLTLGEACGVGELPFVSSPQIRKKDAEQDASRKALWYLSLSGTAIGAEGADGGSGSGQAAPKAVGSARYPSSRASGSSSAVRPPSGGNAWTREAWWQWGNSGGGGPPSFR